MLLGTGAQRAGSAGGGSEDSLTAQAEPFLSHLGGEGDEERGRKVSVPGRWLSMDHGQRGVGATEWSGTQVQTVAQLFQVMQGLNCPV